MTPLQTELINRFGAHRVSELNVADGEVPLLALTIESRSPVTVVMTNGLSDYTMNVPEVLKGLEHNELYFCLPSYWDLEDDENPTMNWVIPWIQRLTNYVIEKESWFGHGHTMPCGKEMNSLSPTMHQNHFFLSNPILLEKELAQVKIGDKSIQFLGIIPIFPDEMDYKQGKGTLKLMRKFLAHGVTELLDDYRKTVLSTKWRLTRMRK